jgi:hypothetical protein
MLFPKTEKPSPALKGEGTHRDTPSTLSPFTKSSSHLSDSDLVTTNICSHTFTSAADRSWLNGFFVLGNELQSLAPDAVLCADGSRHTTGNLNRTPSAGYFAAGRTATGSKAVNWINRF